MCLVNLKNANIAIELTIRINMTTLYVLDTADEFCEPYELECVLTQENITYPVELVAVNSNWRGQTGTAEAEDFDELLSKCLSFGNDSLELVRDSNELYFHTSSHDVPAGFNIYIKELL